MNAKRVSAIVLATCLLAALIPVTGYAADADKDLSVYFRPAVRFGTDNRTLFIIDLLAPVYRGNKDILFLNGKFSPDDHDAWETNTGIGYRRLVLSDRLILGGNLFYDHRKTRYGSHFDQIGLGLEAMADPGGVGLTGRVNFYQPLTKAKLGEDFTYAFYGNGIYTAGIEEPMTGFDYEAGVRIPWISDYVETWVYAGGYHFFGNHVKDVNGFSARIEAIPADFMRLNLEYRNDTINQGEYYGEVAVELPFSIENLVTGRNPFAGIGDVLSGSRALSDRMVEPVRRDVDIVVGTGYLSGPDAAGDGTLMEGVIFVSDSAEAGGDGSFEHPYDTLAGVAGDTRLGDTVGIVHVLRGEGTGLSGEAFGQDGITIWGAGTANPQYPHVANLVPGYPLITSTLYLSGAGMTAMGLNLELSDYAAVSIGGDALSGGFTVFANRILSGGLYGIYAEGPGSIGAPATPAVIVGNTISVGGGNHASGIYLESYGENIYALVRNNSIHGISGEYDAIGIHLTTASGGIDTVISGNTITGVDSYLGNAAGIYLSGSGDLNALVTGNTVSGIISEDSHNNGCAYGIYASAPHGFLTGSISGNTVSDISATYNWGDAYAYGVYAYGLFGSTVDIDNNTISDVHGMIVGYGIYSIAYSMAYSGSINGNSISGVDGMNAYGIYADAYSSPFGLFTGEVSGNTVSDIRATGGSSIGGIFVRSGGDFLGSISDNTISNVSGGGYFNWSQWPNGICAFVVGDFTGSITGNSIDGVTNWWGSANGGAFADGIMVGYVTGDIGGTISGNTVSGINAYRAAGIYLGNTGTVGNAITTTVTNNTLAASGTVGAYGLYTSNTHNQIGMVFMGNTGTITGPTVYAAYFDPITPAGSFAVIGAGRGGMGSNDLTNVGSWGGNYPFSGGPLFADGYPEFLIIR